MRWSVGLTQCLIIGTGIKKHRPRQFALNFDDPYGRDDEKTREIKRARNILVYIDRVHRCLNDVYENLVDREYQDFMDEVESAIEYLEYLRDNADKTF